MSHDTLQSELQTEEKLLLLFIKYTGTEKEILVSFYMLQRV